MPFGNDDVVAAPSSRGRIDNHIDLIAGCQLAEINSEACFFCSGHLDRRVPARVLQLEDGLVRPNHVRFYDFRVRENIDIGIERTARRRALKNQKSIHDKTGRNGCCLACSEVEDQGEHTQCTGSFHPAVDVYVDGPGKQRRGSRGGQGQQGQVDIPICLGRIGIKPCDQQESCKSAYRKNEKNNQLPRTRRFFLCCCFIRRWDGCLRSAHDMQIIALPLLAL